MLKLNSLQGLDHSDIDNILSTRKWRQWPRTNQKSIDSNIHHIKIKLSGELVTSPLLVYWCANIINCSRSWYVNWVIGSSINWLKLWICIFIFSVLLWLERKSGNNNQIYLLICWWISDILELSPHENNLISYDCIESDFCRA